MSTSLYTPLRIGLNEIYTTLTHSRASTSSRSSPQPITTLEIQDRLHPLLASLGPLANADGQQIVNIELLKSTLDLVGRELVVTPLTKGELDASDASFQTSLQDRLNIVITLYEAVFSSYAAENSKSTTPLRKACLMSLGIGPASLEPGAVFIPLLEDLVDLLSVASWRDLWTWVESNSKRFTADMPASKGKALPLLRIINSFLRSLPRTPEDLVFRGRVHQFASSVISIADKSAINMRGDYGDVVTTWEEDEVVGNDEVEIKVDTEGDVEMKVEVKEEKPDTESLATTKSLDFYPTLWSLQKYFSHPPSLQGGSAGTHSQTPWEDFKAKSDFVLPKLFEQTQRERDLMGQEDTTPLIGQKRKREDEGFFHPRYLTGKRLLEHELSDPSFRRQILTQYFILFQFLLNLTPTAVTKQNYTGGMKDLIIDADKEVWIKGKIRDIRNDLKRMKPDGVAFDATVLSIITKEKHYGSWKNEGCPEGVFEIPAMNDETAVEAAKEWKRRLNPPGRMMNKLGSPSLSAMWMNGFKGIDQLKNRKRKTTLKGFETLLDRIDREQEEVNVKVKFAGEAADEEKEADKAKLEDLIQRKVKLNWRALRMLSRSDLGKLGMMKSTRDVREPERQAVAEVQKKAKLAEKLAEQLLAAKAEQEKGEEEEGVTAEAGGVEVKAEEVVKDGDGDGDGDVDMEKSDAGEGAAGVVELGEEEGREQGEDAKDKIIQTPGEDTEAIIQNI